MDCPWRLVCTPQTHLPPFTRFTKISQIDSEHLSAALCLRINNYRTSNTRANVSESIGSRAVCLQLIRKSVSGTISHVHTSEHAMKSLSP